MLKEVALNDLKYGDVFCISDDEGSNKYKFTELSEYENDDGTIDPERISIVCIRLHDMKRRYIEFEIGDGVYLVVTKRYPKRAI